MDRTHSKSVDQIVCKTGMSEEDAHAMILLTAALMDLHPDDYAVVEIILQDCGVTD